MAINTSVIKIKKEDRDNFERENKYLNEQLSMKSAHCEQLSSQKTELVLSNAELTARVQKLEEELATIKKRVSDLENVFYKNGVISQGQRLHKLHESGMLTSKDVEQDIDEVNARFLAKMKAAGLQ